MDATTASKFVYVSQHAEQKVSNSRAIEIVAIVLMILSALTIGEMVLFSGANYYLTIPAFVGAISFIILVIKLWCSKKSLNENAPTLNSVVWERATVAEKEVTLHNCYDTIEEVRTVHESQTIADVISSHHPTELAIVTSVEGIETIYEKPYEPLKQQCFTLSDKKYDPIADGTYYLESSGKLCTTYSARKSSELMRLRGRALVIPAIDNQPKMISIPITWSHDSLEIDHLYYLNSMVAGFAYLRSQGEKRPVIHVACPWGEAVNLASSTRAMVSLFIAAARIADVDLIFHPEQAPKVKSLIMRARNFEVLTQELLDELINIVQQKKTPNNLLSFISYQKDQRWKPERY